MVMVMGVGVYSVGLFYLMIYVYFKVMLFLCFGLVIYGMEVVVGYNLVLV